jgi:class 3 adenylate cyclase
MAETRKLVAILAADVVGYSRLAGTDEDRTLARLRALRSDLIDPTVAVHNRRVVKRTGDGSLIEFRSVVDAVRCAIEVQNGMVERNAGVPPERRIEFRVGIHLGDVVEESDGDLMGDGVNIAARLQGIAKPGAICLSEDAYRQVKTRLDLAVSDLGPTKLKNIAEPVRVFSLEVGKPAQAKPVKPVKHLMRMKRPMLAPIVAGVRAENSNRSRQANPTRFFPPDSTDAPTPQIVVAALKSYTDRCWDAMTRRHISLRWFPRARNKAEAEMRRCRTHRLRTRFANLRRPLTATAYLHDAILGGPTRPG